MQVTRLSLPGPATIIVFKARRRIIVDAGLTRDQAALAIQGVLPDLHPDVIDHWLDGQFERRSIPFTARHLPAMVGTVLTILGLFTPHDATGHHHQAIHTAHAPIVLAVPGTRTV